jgi:hypothetical protein
MPAEIGDGLAESAVAREKRLPQNGGGSWKVAALSETVDLYSA